jgi:DNA repair protein RadA/Sms
LGFDGIFISKFNTKGLDAKKYNIAIRPVAKLEDIFSALFG